MMLAYTVIETLLWYATKWATLGLFVTVAISAAIVISGIEDKHND